MLPKPGVVGGNIEQVKPPGLRRDEVAELASMSTNYYEKPEQARGPRPSPTVLAAIARSHSG